MDSKVTAAIFLFLASCTIVEVLDIAEPDAISVRKVQRDSTQIDTTEKKDTLRIPIGFDVTVDEWDESEDVEL